jgi:hypothetical protein
MSGERKQLGRFIMKQLWKKWTVDKPAAFGDRLWEVFVVQLAARLDRLTLRDVIAFIPVLILIFAYWHRIPIPPELMLVGDLLAYIDVFAMVFLLSMIGRVGVVLYVMKRMAERTFLFANAVRNALLRFDFRHRRATGVRRETSEDEPMARTTDLPRWMVLLGPSSVTQWQCPVGVNHVVLTLGQPLPVCPTNGHR